MLLVPPTQRILDRDPGPAHSEAAPSTALEDPTAQAPVQVRAV